MVIWKIEDGWSGRHNGPFTNFLIAYDSIQEEIYEIKTCRRLHTFEEMREALLAAVDQMKEDLTAIEGDEIEEAK